MGALLDALPAGTSVSSLIARERMLLDYVQRGFTTWNWQDVAWTEGGHTIVFRCMADGLKVEGVRIDASATLSQLVADEIQAILPTPKMCDIIWQKANVKLKPLTRQITATTASMIDQSHRTDVAIGEGTGVIGNLGKYWVLTNKLLQDSNGCGSSFPPIKVPDVAANYGWYVSSGGDPSVSGDFRVIQSVGRCHGRLHVDYSQLLQVVSQQAVLDGSPVDIRDILTSPKFAYLLSVEGQLQIVRQPGADAGWGSGEGGGGYVIASDTHPLPSGGTAPGNGGSQASNAGGGGGTGLGTALAYAFATGIATALAFELVAMSKST